MNAMKHLALTLIFSLLLTVALAAQEKPKADANSNAKPATAMPTVDEVLEKNIKALGGKEALEKQTSRTAKGSVEIEGMGMTGSVEMLAKAPARRATIVTFESFGVIHSVFDGSSGWASDPQGGLRELGGAELTATKRDSDFHSELNFKKNYPKAEVKGKEKVGSSEAYVIEATPAEGGPEKFYYDATTGLLLRHDADRETPQGKMMIETYLSDYREVEGVKLPHTLRQVTPAFSLTIKLTEVKPNAPIDDAKFSKPQ
jgi:outer membrane lipoprotein-sorting protein